MVFSLLAKILKGRAILEASSIGDLEALYRILKPLKCSVDGEKLLEYYVGFAKVSIVRDDRGEYIYCVDEPDADDNDIMAIARLLDSVGPGVSEGDIGNTIDVGMLCKHYGVNCGYNKEERALLNYYLAKAVSGYGPLYPLLKDVNVEELAVDGPWRPVAVLHRRLDVGWIRSNVILSSDVLDTLVLYMARRAGKSLSLAYPYAEGLLPEGHRIAATYGREISRHGSSIVVRKHLERPYSIIELVEGGMLSYEIAAYLWLLIELKASILVIGPAAAGKTTFLQALLGLIPPNRRIVTIEDTPELNLSSHPHWDSLYTRYVYGGEGENIDLFSLAKFALRRRADYIVIGEVRGVEAQLLVYAATSGHGALATFHADSAQTALLRLRAPPISIGESFLSALTAIVTVSRLQVGDVGKRVVLSVSEVAMDASRGIGTVEVVRYNIASREWEPSEATELVDNAPRLRERGSMVGLGQNDLVELIISRAAFLKQLSKEGVKSFDDVVKRVSEYYRRGFSSGGKVLSSQR